jgi:hypothetical protein
VKVRNKSDNTNYIDYLETAADQIEQAIDSVTYTSYPEINKRLAAKLKEAIDILDACSRAAIFKP